MSEYITPLKKVRGLGASKTGVHHWTAQRFTAIANIFLTLWLFCFLINVTNMGYNASYVYIGEPFNAICALLFVVSSFYHAKLGLQTIIEDYIHHRCLKIGSLISMNILVYGAIFASFFLILKISL